MAKKLEIVGKVWVLQKCIECPLLDSDAMCVIDNKHRPKFDEECENCPLPDATDASAEAKWCLCDISTKGRKSRV